jgi:hypothetical protein
VRTSVGRDPDEIPLAAVRQRIGWHVDNGSGDSRAFGLPTSGEDSASLLAVDRSPLRRGSSQGAVRGGSSFGRIGCGTPSPAALRARRRVGVECVDFGKGVACLADLDCLTYYSRTYIMEDAAHTSR